MSFIIRNISGGAVSIDDLGINLLAPLDEHNLNQEPPNDVAISLDLPANITAGNIAVLDPLDGVTILSTVDALDLIAATNDPHFRIRGGRAVDVTFDNTGIDNIGTDLQAAVVDNSGKVKWRNIWAEQTYEKHDMVIDGDWTMIANTQTTDRAAPQAIGAPEETPDAAIVFATSSDSSVVRMVHHYVISKSGWVNSIAIHTPFWDIDSVSRVTIFNVTTNESIIIENPILSSDNWVTVKNSNSFVTAGDVYEVWFEYYNSTSANAIDGGWTSLLATGTPALSSFNINNLTVPTAINIDHTDLDATDRSTELDGVVAGSIIRISETGDPSRSFEVEVTVVDTLPVGYTGYTTTLLHLGSKGSIRSGRTCTVHIDVPISQPSEYSFNTDYYLGTTNQPSWATITTELYYDGIQQADVNDAYGIGIIFQEASISPDWDVVSTAGGGSSSSEGGGGGGGEANTASNLGAGDGVFAQKNGVDLEFKSLTVGTGVSITPSGSELLITNTAPNIVQDLWATISSDSGSTVANAPTDTLTVSGGAGISTAVVGDILTISVDTTDDLATVTVGTPTPAAIPLVFADVQWGATHVENDTAVIEHDAINTERIIIKETGLYLIAFSMSFDADAVEESIQGQVVANNLTIVPGSLRLASEDDEINDLSNTFTAELTTGDYLTFQCQASGAGNTIHTTSNFMVTRARGTRGDVGAAGSGSNINVEELGVLVPNSPFSTLNFGDGFSAVDGGGGVVDITSDFAGTMPAVQAKRTTDYLIGTTYGTITYDINDIETDNSILNHTPGGSRITILEDGLYLVGFSLSGVDYRADQSTETSIAARVILNGVLTAIPGSEVHDGNYYSSSGDISEDTFFQHTFLVELVTSDYIEVQAESQALRVAITNYTATNTSDIIFFAIKQEGAKGDTGVAGSGSSINVEDDGALVPNTPFTNLNFTGGFTATDAGGGTVDIAADFATGDIAAVQKRKSTQQTITTTPAYVVWELEDIENDPTIIEGTNTTTIQVKETGEYSIAQNLLSNSGNAGTIVTSRVILNGVSIIPGTEYAVQPDSKIKATTPTTIVELTANDTLQVEVLTDTNTGTIEINSLFSVIRLHGVKGDPGTDGTDGLDGAPGSGSTLIVKDEGINVANTPHSAFNFIGAGVSVVDGGAGVADITITGTAAQIVNKNVSATVTTTTTIPITTTPTSTSGNPFDSLAITMGAAANKVRFQMVLPCDIDNDATAAVVVVSRGTTVLAVGAMGTKKESTQQIYLDFYDTPGAGTHTYSVRVGTTSNTSYFNLTKVDATPWGGVAFTNNCNITLTEITV